MTYLHDNILDAALSYISTNAENLYITSAEATTFTEASDTYALGVKASPGFTGPANGDTNGRKLTIDAITDGTVTGSDTATHIAITDDSATLLLYTKALSSSQGVTSGNTFSLTAHDIEIPDAA